MNKDIDAQFLCKDCERYNLCQYYDRRKEDSYICKYFHLSVEPCEDTISRQAVIEQINCWIGSGEYRYTNATDYLTKRISKLPPVTPKQKMGHWIPVSERLPEEPGEYFITWTTSMSKRPLIAICEGEVTIEYGFEWILDSYIKCYPNVKVIAWMPLPEPYKAESED